ncbi:hypothetical protein [Mucilaginibacter sp. KACC 22063]|uniref:hypothetical protein n=1 Tax=Mucilaginibacter sp. KACC 22063 TaxID=3025666 RepID=UPI002366E178|nr:hypothetical protein [Mucilaginibacter sp. KACC 22063]WDF54065.1 hypothetical protein PQ461_14050 [Mucilaginibacter sp. KACC 22063]
MKRPALICVSLLLAAHCLSGCFLHKQKSNKQVAIKRSSPVGTSNTPDTTKRTPGVRPYPDPSPAPIPNPNPNPPSPNP